MQRTTAKLTTMTIATAALVLAGTTAFAGSAAADGSRNRLSGPPVTVLQCEEGGGFVATDIRTRRDYCEGGEYNGRYVTWDY
ncbi:MULTISPECIES: hypothetical protein [Kitasatospora]|uniref:hypothetical protein n=1 Tax=Kitasatospora TaxID=2063 RepID=UPI000C703FD7|nr:hypothetical protein [Kitasatospora sp. GP30]MDH6142430.1 hypothetical protein [Kitasatospora sp. GP30]